MVEIRRQNFSIDEIVERMKQAKIGAISIYLGTVREFPEGLGLDFDDDKHAIRKLEEIEKGAIDRFDIEDVAIVHRVGLLGISENILLVAVSAAHRESAFDVCRSIVDDIKDFHKSWGREIAK
ncbi:MAG: molybdenum cofactor biosynthesis protein MoaE [Dehalococcoidia bacterium]